MRHFDFLPQPEVARLFQRPPEPFSADEAPVVVGTGLGATLYSPATRPRLAQDIVRRRAEGTLACVVCLEDAVPDAELPAAERNALAQLRALGEHGGPLPMLFVRVRNAAQIRMLVDGLGEQERVLTGFVLPKFDEDTGDEFLTELDAVSARVQRRLLAMPVLETTALAHAETRVESLLAARRLVDKHRERIPAVRVGATDICGAYGIRRTRELTVWDVRVVAEAISAVVNVFGRAEGARDAGWVVSGPVWEYFPAAERLFKPQLRATPFIAHEERALRADLIRAELDGLIREIALDRANGLTGKTVIHPTHVAAVNALSVVGAEEYADASDVLASDARGGATASSFGNKMNESKPHSTWAARVMLRARLFGVARPEVSFVDLLGAGLHR